MKGERKSAEEKQRRKRIQAIASIEIKNDKKIKISYLTNPKRAQEEYRICPLKLLPCLALVDW